MLGRGADRVSEEQPTKPPSRIGALRLNWRGHQPLCEAVSVGAVRLDEVGYDGDEKQEPRYSERSLVGWHVPREYECDDYLGPSLHEEPHHPEPLFWLDLVSQEELPPLELRPEEPALRFPKELPFFQALFYRQIQLRVRLQHL